MSASDHLSRLQFKDLPGGGPLSHKIEAHDEAGNVVGSLEWAKDIPERRIAAGAIIMAKVQPDHQRKGVASEMLRRAREIEPKVHHSAYKTDMGTAWAKARP